MGGGAIDGELGSRKISWLSTSPPHPEFWSANAGCEYMAVIWSLNVGLGKTWWATYTWYKKGSVIERKERKKVWERKSDWGRVELLKNCFEPKKWIN